MLQDDPWWLLLVPLQEEPDRLDPTRRMTSVCSLTNVEVGDELNSPTKRLEGSGAAAFSRSSRSRGPESSGTNV